MGSATRGEESQLNFPDRKWGGGASPKTLFVTLRFGKSYYKHSTKSSKTFFSRTYTKSIPFAVGVYPVTSPRKTWCYKQRRTELPARLGQYSAFGQQPAASLPASKQHTIKSGNLTHPGGWSFGIKHIFWNWDDAMTIVSLPQYN